MCKVYRKTCYKCKGSGHLVNVCTAKKEDAKSNAMTAVQGEDKSRAVFSSIQMKDEVSKIGNLDWGKKS